MVLVCVLLGCFHNFFRLEIPKDHSDSASFLSTTGGSKLAKTEELLASSCEGLPCRLSPIPPLIG